VVKFDTFLDPRPADGFSRCEYLFRLGVRFFRENNRNLLTYTLLKCSFNTAITHLGLWPKESHSRCQEVVSYCLDQTIGVSRTMCRPDPTRTRGPIAVKKLPAIERISPPESATNPTATLTVLSVSPLDEDYSSLRDIIGDGKGGLLKARDLVGASALLRERDVAVVVCNRELPPGTYIDLLEQIKAIPNPPSLIVASRLADERLWAEALNLGAWDVLAKPFDRNEAVRSVRSGWQRWHSQLDLRAKVATIAADN